MRQAAAAAAITASASSREASATFLVTQPVAGSYTGAVRSLLPANGAPAAQCTTVGSSAGGRVASPSALGNASGSVIVVMVGVLPGDSGRRTGQGQTESGAGKWKAARRGRRRSQVRPLGGLESVVGLARRPGEVQVGDLGHRDVPPAVAAG